MVMLLWRLSQYVQSPLGPREDEVIDEPGW